ncbi:cobalt-precorrin 5A hydrolase [Gynuella sunshinyii]|uniref:Cobalamin biosynthesis protein CbiG n=1 Tax=Gynuella sunshinyii YC6258 TaxID=1445510 RepID=A0A0C5VCF7_9GAMM|nr:cobalamin biosynthesis protein [Gynuella sunshinyii]AJQ92172.1 cobalamin biosynthesis protein CbiG [Gynuella sunshinyii YC6258]
MIRIIALTETGHDLARRIQAYWPDSRLDFCPQPFTATVQQAFLNGERLIMICAMGIAVRTLAPVLADKHRDPAVLVLDEHGQFVVPLLSGHEGGANEWGRQLAGKLTAQLVLTTANPYLKPVYAVGMGCERGCSVTEIAELFHHCLGLAGLTAAKIETIHSIDIKADETGFIDFCNHVNKKFQTWSAEQLNTVKSQLSTRSDYVFRVVGVYGVAESAALYGAMAITGTPAELILNKHKSQRATCAIARSYPRTYPQEYTQT